MVKKTRPEDASEFAETVRASAQQIWLAGLGALAKAQAEGGKLFQNLVQEGQAMHRKTQAAAGEKMGEAGQRMSGMAEDLSARASGQWEKLEQLAEERVARALKRLGVPTAEEVEALQDEVEDLREELEALRRRLDRMPQRPGRSTAGKTARPTAGSASAATPKPAPKRRADREPG